MINGINCDDMDLENEAKVTQSANVLYEVCTQGAQIWDN